MAETHIVQKSDTEVVIEGSLPETVVAGEKDAALKTLGADIEMKGFRKGHVPEKMLVERIGETRLWQEMAERALSRELPKIIDEHTLRVIGRPAVNITKLAPGNDLEFKVTVHVLPEITLPDYKTIAARHNETPPETSEVTDKDVEEAIANIKKQATAMSGGTVKESDELTDAFVQKLGPYENVADFKKKLREQLKLHKTHAAREKRRLAIIEDIISEAKPSVPSVLVDAELDKMLAQMRADIDRAGLQIDAYFKQIGKTEDDFRKEWRPDAEKRARIQLMLNEIAVAEKIQPDEREVKGQTEAILKQHPPKNKDRQHAELATRIYVATQLTNERVFTFLEDQKA